MSPTIEPLWREYFDNGPHCAAQELRQTCHCYLERISQVLGMEFTDALTGAIDDQHAAELENAYKEGFVTAFRLWMEMAAE